MAKGLSPRPPQQSPASSGQQVHPVEPDNGIAGRERPASADRLGDEEPVEGGPPFATCGERADAQRRA